jgi:2-iminobutanoate/2-iminopropanoate deaminase
MTPPDAAALPAVPLSPARAFESLVFTSGQIGREADGSVPSDFARQAELAIDALVEALEGLGASLATVVKTTVYITDAADFAAMNEIYAQRFAEPWPARTTLVSALAHPSLTFEIEAIARRTDAR